MVALRSSAPKYMLRNKEGEFLHGSGSGFSKDPTYAWVGTSTQRNGLVKQNPKLKDLDPVPLINHTRKIASI